MNNCYFKALNQYLHHVQPEWKHVKEKARVQLCPLSMDVRFLVDGCCKLGGVRRRLSLVATRRTDNSRMCMLRATWARLGANRPHLRHQDNEGGCWGQWHGWLPADWDSAFISTTKAYIL